MVGEWASGSKSNSLRSRRGNATSRSNRRCRSRRATRAISLQDSAATSAVASPSGPVWPSSSGSFGWSRSPAAATFRPMRHRRRSTNRLTAPRSNSPSRPPSPARRRPGHVAPPRPDRRWWSEQLGGPMLPTRVRAPTRRAHDARRPDRHRSRHWRDDRPPTFRAARAEPRRRSWRARAGPSSSVGT